MFQLIENAIEIERAQSKLVKTIHREFRKSYTANIGYPGGTTYDAELASDGTYWFWNSDDDQVDAPNPRRLNWFGLLRQGRHQEITVEINTPLSGRNDQVAGFFAKDPETKAVYLMHSGRVGGGTKGVSKSAFLAWGDVTPIESMDANGNVKAGVLVMPIESKAASSSAARYVGLIARFKVAVREGVAETPEFQAKKAQFEQYYSEASGRRKGKRSAAFDYISRHGEVVDALNLWREHGGLPKGHAIVKNVLIDLGVAKKDKLSEVFEVKTSTSRTDLYTAIGQLLVHADQGCSMSLVLPVERAIPRDVQAAIQRLQIKVLRFKFKKSGACIV